MLKLSRVCVPLSLDCDLKCRYCYREGGEYIDVPPFNDLMRRYLRGLSPDWCRAVVASGGEPLLHQDKVYELFSYVPKNIHKKVMTNGLNLTKEFVDYANENKIEVSVSHDGECTEWLRGIDVLKEQDINQLVRQIDDLKIVGVVTNKNPNPYQNYKVTSKLLERTDFVYTCPIAFGGDWCSYLTDNMDWISYSRGYIKLQMMSKAVRPEDKNDPSYKPKRSNGFNVLPDGTVCSMAEIQHFYGTVEDSLETLLKNKTAMGDDRVCKNTKCDIRDVCGTMSQIASPITCKASRITAQTFDFLSHCYEENNETSFYF